MDLLSLRQNVFVGACALLLTVACSDAPPGQSIDGGDDLTDVVGDIADDVVDPDVEDVEPGDIAPDLTEDIEGDVADLGDDAADLGDDTEDVGPDAELGPCATCHGSVVNAAPPVDTNGRSDTALRTVGAHQTHLDDSFIFRTVECRDCHIVPTDVPSHVDGPPAEVDFGNVARSDGVEPVWEDGSCWVYCHGVTLSGGTDTEPEWTTVDGTYSRCGACHGIPPTEGHPSVPVTSCLNCHPFDGGPIGHETHVDGNLNVIGGGCGGCHALPPDTGAHRAHVSVPFEGESAVYGDMRITAEIFPGGIDGYVFGCGNCHPTDESNHFNNVVDLLLHEPDLFVEPPYGGAAESPPLKARNPDTAEYLDGRCSNVYCHSGGQAIPVFVESPLWDGGSFEGSCGACHGNPPAYASTGAGELGANTHLVVGDHGYEVGHFGGLVGAWHGSDPGRTRGSAPITCQTCHYDTVDPTNTGPSGFYYLDTTGNYDAGGALDFSCATEGCHAEGDDAAPLGEGAVLTGRHVDGMRDVVFDSRTELPDDTPNIPDPAPTFPFWVDAVPNTRSRPVGTDVSDGLWSFHLGALDLGDIGVIEAMWDSELLSCSNVPCHLKQSYGVGEGLCSDGREACSDAYEPLQWGVTPVGYATCNACHQM